MRTRKTPAVSKRMPNASPKTSEYLTRKQIVDAKLQTAGWKISRFDPDRPLTAFDRCAIEEFPTENGPADYALCVGGEILGVVEAKKLTLGPQEVLPQAERYSRGLTPSRFNFDGFHVPFLYSTNGEIIWHRDVRGALNRSRQIAAFHTPDALREFLARDADDAARVLAARPTIIRTCAPTSSKPIRRLSRRSRAASARCLSRWRPAPARPSRW